eukprot:jgi/Ulvmu1/5762/UM025_0016.1
MCAKIAISVGSISRCEAEKVLMPHVGHVRPGAQFKPSRVDALHKPEALLRLQCSQVDAVLQVVHHVVVSYNNLHGLVPLGPTPSQSRCVPTGDHGSHNSCTLRRHSRVIMERDNPISLADQCRPMNHEQSWCSLQCSACWPFPSQEQRMFYITPPSS